MITQRVEFTIITINLIFIFGIGWWGYKRFAEAHTGLYWAALGTKLTAGLAVGWLYMNHYSSADTFSLFNDSKLLAGWATQDVQSYARLVWDGSPSDFTDIGVFNLEPRSLFFVKILSFISILTHGNYWVDSLYLSLICFLASFILVKKLLKYFPESKSSIVLAFLFFPSVVFWSSGILKESIGLACIYAIVSVFLSVWNREMVGYELIVGLLAVIVLWNIRYFYAGMLMPCIVSAIVIRKVEFLERRPLLSFGMLIVILFSVTTLLHPNFSLGRILDVVISNQEAFLAISDPQDVIHYYQPQATWTSFVINVPWALFSGLFRPLPWEADNVWQVMASIENALILAGTVLLISGLTSFGTSRNRLMIVVVLSYCVLLCVFLAMSTPNFGSLARYRVGFLPFYVMLILDQRWLRQMIGKWRSA